jgi:hypothetical protein
MLPRLACERRFCVLTVEGNGATNDVDVACSDHELAGGQFFTILGGDDAAARDDAPRGAMRSKRVLTLGVRLQH